MWKIINSHLELYNHSEFPDIGVTGRSQKVLFVKSSVVGHKRKIFSGKGTNVEAGGGKEGLGGVGYSDTGVWDKCFT